MAMSTDTSPDPWKPLDPLGAALHFLRISGVFYCRCEFTAPWGLELPPFSDCMMFHVVTGGQCSMVVDGAEPCQLREGDFALVPHGGGHTLRSDPAAVAGKLFDLPRELLSDRYEVLRHGAGGPATTMICGVVRLDDRAAQQLVALFPAIIKVEGWTAPQEEWIESTLRFLTAEASALHAGGETVITRLADILVIQAIRSWIARDPAAQRGWLGALRDPQIGRAIGAIHREPTRPWTLAALADAAGMSRSAFAARFTQLVGEPAMRYVARWKMHAAHRWLLGEDASVVELAQRLGYDSEAAFSRAFKRFLGVSPGAVRRAQRRMAAG
jgi:AraC-like DNA-binding protein